MSSTAATTICTGCGKNEAVLGKFKYETVHKNMKVSIPNVERYFCTGCKQEFFTEEQKQAASQRVKEFVL